MAALNVDPTYGLCTACTGKYDWIVLCENVLRAAPTMICNPFR